jgi:hypothetical protein
MLALPGIAAADPAGAVAVVGRTRPARREQQPAELIDAAFEEFWAAYPRRRGKVDARKAWDKIAKDPRVDLALIIDGARRYRDDGARRRAGSDYTAYPATWLRGERWNDELQPQTAEPTLSTADKRVLEGQAVVAKFRAMEARGEI